jgi:phosphatidylinositol alpha-1,6-mannosyltransferase
VSTLLVSEVFPPRTGGSGRWFWEVYRRLPRADYLIAAGEDAQQAAFDATHDLRVVRVPLTMRAWGLRSFHGLVGYGRGLKVLRSLVRTEAVDTLHCGRCLPEGVMALAIKRLTGVPYLCYVHGEDIGTARTSRELTWLVRRVLRGAQLLIANSKSTERMLREQWAVPAERLQVLHPGVDTARFVPASFDRACRDRMGWSGRPVVLTVGRLQQRKGHDQMIRALPRIIEKVPDVLYAIVGDGAERERLQILAAQTGVVGHVQFLGEISDDQLVSCYQQCDLFALPNYQVGGDIEGFGMVLLEAQACGKPVLAGASGGTAETMHAGRTGQVLDCERVGPLAGCVASLLLDRERSQQMGSAARQWVVERFDWEALSREAERIFREATDRCAARNREAVYA